MVANTAHGVVHEVTNYKPTQQKVEEDTKQVEEIASEGGADYIKTQKNLPDVITVGGDPTAPHRFPRGRNHEPPRRPRQTGRGEERGEEGHLTAADGGPRPAQEQRDRLLEKFTIMQTDLGGAFYEMAIRDHVRIDVLTAKAAELQRVDAELLTLERMLELDRADAAGLCTKCGSPYGHTDRFCPQCGTSLVPQEAAG